MPEFVGKKLCNNNNNLFNMNNVYNYVTHN